MVQADDSPGGTTVRDDGTGTVRESPFPHPAQGIARATHALPESSLQANRNGAGNVASGSTAHHSRPPVSRYPQGLLGSGGSAEGTARVNCTFAPLHA